MASSIEQLKREIMREMAAAMNDAKEDMFDELQGEVMRYYTGSPKIYHRTYQMLTTPRADPVTSGAESVNTRLYLFEGGGYSTGSNPSMLDVLKLANYGIRFTTANGYPARDTVGRKGFWERSLTKMDIAFNRAFSSHFN